MLKVADALHEAGYRVTMISARFMDWAWEADLELRKTRSWKWIHIDHTRTTAPGNWILSGTEHRLARYAAGAAGANRLPLPVAAAAYGRIHSLLVNAAVQEDADLYYGGTAGTLAATARAAAKTGKPYALDLEDFHSAEHDETPSGTLDNQLARRIETAILPQARFLTTAGTTMGKAYVDAYGFDPIPINNVSPLPSQEPDFERAPTDALRLYWFGQTIGIDKQLQLIVQAVGKAQIPADLHIRGRVLPGCGEYLRTLTAEAAPGIRLIISEPATPSQMVDLCRPHDIGLSMFVHSPVLNWNIALGNKTLTYLAAGLAIALSDTPGHQLLKHDLLPDCVLYKSGDYDSLARGLKRMWEDPAALRRARKASWEAARRRWHWEHQLERGAVLDAVASAVSPAPARDEAEITP